MDLLCPNPNCRSLLSQSPTCDFTHQANEDPEPHFHNTCHNEDCPVQDVIVAKLSEVSEPNLNQSDGEFGFDRGEEERR